MKHRFSTIAAITGLALSVIALSSETAQTFSAQIFSSASVQSLQVVSVSLTASPEVYDGLCPATITFSGNITVKGKGPVKYTFLRSDGASAPVYTLDFDSDGTKLVDTTWTLGLPTFDGWQSIKILSPSEMESNRAWFKGSCQQQSPPSASQLSVPAFSKVRSNPFK